MDTRKWLGFGTLAVLGAGLGFYYRFLRPSPSLLPRLTVPQVFRKAHRALDRVEFSEILAYQNNLLPQSLNIPRLLNLPVPDSSVHTVALYEESPKRWRLQELNDNNAVVGVVARRGAKVIAYVAADNERTVEVLPKGMATWAPWGLPSFKTWHSSVKVLRFDGRPAYRVTLTPLLPGTLWGSLTYWFDGSSFVPLGMRVKNAAGDVAFMARAQRLTLGPPGEGANLPTAGRQVAWRVSPIIAAVVGKVSSLSGSYPAIRFPPTLGPLARSSQHQVGDNALAVYGTGAGRVLVVDTAAAAFKGPGAPFLHPVSALPGGRGVTDGIFAIVTFHRHGREVTLFSSRPQAIVAQWAKAAWR